MLKFGTDTGRPSDVLFTGHKWTGYWICDPSLGQSKTKTRHTIRRPVANNFQIQYIEHTMVLIIDGNSDHGAHA